MKRGPVVAVGACLVVVGFVMRGLARDQRRESARRKQHDLTGAAPAEDGQPDAFDRHLARWLPRYGNACVTLGFILIGAALFS